MLGLAGGAYAAEFSTLSTANAKSVGNLGYAQVTASSSKAQAAKPEVVVPNTDPYAVGRGLAASTHIGAPKKTFDVEWYIGGERASINEISESDASGIRYPVYQMSIDNELEFLVNFESFTNPVVESITVLTPKATVYTTEGDMHMGDTFAKLKSIFPKEMLKVYNPVVDVKEIGIRFTFDVVNQGANLADSATLKMIEVYKPAH
jgi:hypothetical protein